VQGDVVYRFMHCPSNEVTVCAKEFSFALSIVFLTVGIILFKKKNNRYIHLTLSLVRGTFSVSVNFCDKDS